MMKRDMLTVSRRAAERLRDMFLHKCSDTGIGFRLVAGFHESGQNTIKIVPDRQRENDRIIDLYGMKLFIDPSSSAQVQNYELDWSDDIDTGFCLELSSREEVDVTNR
jgi:Fe-S cluster assembly iron-binding protein IscA